MISSRDNDTLKLVRKLLAQRRIREETGLFAVEGEDLLLAADGAGIDAVHRLVADDTVAPELMATVSTLPHPARAIGVYRAADLPTGARDVCLGLWQLADPGNVGTLIRTADAFGASVALSPGCADPLSPKATRATAGAIFRVPLVSWHALPGRLVGLDAVTGSALHATDLAGPLTFVLGSERAGLSADIRARCDATAYIPMPGDAESLNVAAAGAIALYEALGRRDAA